jgi:hypothetical protein
MFSAKRLKIFILVILAVALGGCRHSQSNVASVVDKYSSPPEDDIWDLVGDTEEFWADVEILYCASLNGDPDAVRTIFIIDTYTDGAVGEGMPDLSEILEKNPEIAGQVILGNARVKEKYSHWLRE